MERIKKARKYAQKNSLQANCLDHQMFWEKTGDTIVVLTFFLHILISLVVLATAFFPIKTVKIANSKLENRMGIFSFIGIALVGIGITLEEEKSQ